MRTDGSTEVTAVVEVALGFRGARILNFRIPRKSERMDSTVSRLTRLLSRGSTLDLATSWKSGPLRRVALNAGSWRLILQHFGWFAFAPFIRGEILWFQCLLRKAARPLDFNSRVKAVLLETAIWTDTFFINGIVVK